MRSFAVAALFAGAVMAAGTTTINEVVTITSCGPEVTDCPGTKTQVPPVSSTPSAYLNSTVPAVSTFSTKVPLTTGSSKPSSVVPPAEECVPSVSVKTISTSIVTTIPTVYYSTVSVPCETAPVITPSAAPSASYPGKTNGTVSTAVPTSSIVAAGAGSVGAPVFLAVAAGMAALLA